MKQILLKWGPESRHHRVEYLIEICSKDEDDESQWFCFFFPLVSLGRTWVRVAAVLGAFGIKIDPGKEAMRGQISAAEPDGWGGGADHGFGGPLWRDHENGPLKASLFLEGQGGGAVGFPGESHSGGFQPPSPNCRLPSAPVFSRLSGLPAADPPCTVCSGRGGGFTTSQLTVS